MQGEPNPSTDSPLTFTDAEAAEREARPFTDAELQRLRHEPFAPLWSSLAGLVARFLATVDAAHPESRPDPGEGRPCRYACPAGVHWHGASSVPTDRPEPIDEERLARAAYEVWPSHTEGSMSQPPSEHDATWRVLDPAAFSDRLIRAIAAAYRTEPGETTDE